MGFLGALAGGVLVHALRDVSFHIEGFRFGHLQIIILLSAVARIPSILLLGFVSDRNSISSRHLLSHLFRGNLLSYTFNTAVYTMARQEQLRARAALALGRSGSPLAIEQLMQALADASPVVRRSAARALGETGSAEATDSLVIELLDGESDIRSEAAEALGRLGHEGGIDPLLEALEDGDPRVRISAIRGLSEIGGDEARELLFWHFGEHLDDPVAFPTLVDVLSHMGDHRVVRPTLQRLDRFRSAAVRLQLLNSVCHALGAGGEFYRLLSREESQRTPALARRLRRVSNSLAWQPRPRGQGARADSQGHPGHVQSPRHRGSGPHGGIGPPGGRDGPGRPVGHRTTTLPGLVRLPRDPRPGDLPDQPGTLRSAGRTGDLRRRLSGAHWRDPSEPGCAAIVGTAGSGGLNPSAWSPAARGTVP